MDSLKINKYKYVKNMLSNDMVEYLSSYSVKKALRKENLYDEQVGPLSTSFHSSESEVYHHFLHHLLPIMEKQTNLKLKPIYCFNRIYLPGSDLKRHTDRGACEISASISLAHSYKNKEYKWPLYMGENSVFIKKGDGVIYKGCEIEHWRPTFHQPEGSWHHQLFVHYVDLNGPNAKIEEEKVLELRPKINIYE